MYERVVLLWPVVVMPIGEPWELGMRRWAPVMLQGGGGMVGRSWNATTKAWFEANPHMFLPYLYARMDFQGEPDMGLPFGYVWGPVGMLYMFFLHLFEYVCTYMFF